MRLVWDSSNASDAPTAQAVPPHEATRSVDSGGARAIRGGAAAVWAGLEAHWAAHRDEDGCTDPVACTEVFSETAEERSERVDSPSAQATNCGRRQQRRQHRGKWRRSGLQHGFATRDARNCGNRRQGTSTHHKRIGQRPFASRTDPI